MSSTLHPLSQGVWTQITTTDKAGEVKHWQGRSQVIYLEATAQPVGQDDTTPVSRTTKLRGDFSYYSIAPAEFLWAYALTGSVTLTVTPAGT
jgi:hypothetical protein